MEADFTDPLTLLRRMPPGSALYTREWIDKGPSETAWLLRDETKRIKALGPSPPVEFRAGLIEQDGVYLIPVLIRVGPEAQEYIFETWINVHQDSEGMRYLEDLAIQDRLLVHLYGERCRLIRSLRVGNQLLEFARETVKRLSGVPPWNLTAFDAAREKIYARYPQIMGLWKAMTSE